MRRNVKKIEGREIVLLSPLAQALKANLISHENGKAILELEITPEHLNHPKGILHGGVIMALVDEAMMQALFSLSYIERIVTSSLFIQFKKVVRRGKIKIEAQVSDYEKAAQGKAKVLNDQNEIIAEAEASFFIKKTKPL